MEIQNKLNWYQEQAKRTCPLLDSDLDIPHMIYGMMSEMPELIQACNNEDKINIGEELTDLVWYLSNYCRFQNIQLEYLVIDVPAPSKNLTIIEDLMWWIGELADINKKEIAYGKVYSLETEINILQNLFYWIQVFYKRYNIDMYNCLDKNIAKLKQRYPEKFTTENALNRDLDAERQILEG